MPDYYALLGVDNPAEGGNEQEVAEPAAENPTAPMESAAEEPDNGGNEQEVAEPAQAEDGDEDSGNGEQTPEQRHQQAAARRQRQQAELEERVKADLKGQHDSEVTEILSAMGLTDPNNDNKPVTNLEEFRAWQDGQKAAKLRRDLKNGDLSEESLQEAIMRMPQIKALADRAAAAEQAVRDAQYHQDVGAQMARIQRMNPAIKSVDDIISLPCGAKFAEYVRNGMNFEDAYTLADRDAILQRSRTAGIQQARNDAAGKAHMKPMTTSGTPGGIVPQKVREYYKLLNPSMTDAEILKAYDKTRKD